MGGRRPLLGPQDPSRELAAKCANIFSGGIRVSIQSAAGTDADFGYGVISAGGFERSSAPRHLPPNHAGGKASTTSPIGYHSWPITASVFQVVTTPTMPRINPSEPRTKACKIG